MSLIVKACGASISRRIEGNRDSPIYWWNDEKAQLRRVCHRTKRRALKARGHKDYLQLMQKHSDACRNLMKGIRSSKRRGWKEFYDEVDNNPWGRPYIIVIYQQSITVLSRTSGQNIDYLLSTSAEDDLWNFSHWGRWRAIYHKRQTNEILQRN